MIIGLVGCGKQDKEDSQKSQNNMTGEEKSIDKGQIKTRTVRDAFGEVEIPVKAERIVAPYLEDYLVALGKEPVVQWYTQTWGKQDYLNLDVPLFDINGDIEVLLDSNPDLIILEGEPDAEKYEKYSKIAPTYWLPKDVNQNMSKTIQTIGDILGVPEKAKEVLKSYEEKAAKAKEELKKTVGNETVAVIRVNIGDKSLALFSSEKGFIGSTMYNDLGLTPHQMVKDVKDYHSVLSLEIIPQLDADHIFIFPSNGDWSSPENKEAIKSVEEGKLWQNLPAVKNGHVYKVDRSHWQTTAIKAKSMQIDDVLKELTK
ncbi:periplasmic binding protein [Gottschalkia acidurici 9a]|uniref:Periplasmic binding protein n=2 Tax=Clostridium acidurici TaxID=1556 RepID=K0AYJ8_GOTA9|nr:periplasmic binding protein [Gottschalkia acidurici 9a]